MVLLPKKRSFNVIFMNTAILLILLYNHINSQIFLLWVSVNPLCTCSLLVLNFNIYIVLMHMYFYEHSNSFIVFVWDFSSGCSPAERSQFNTQLIRLFSEEFARIPKPTPPRYPGAPRGNCFLKFLKYIEIFSVRW